MMGFRQWIGGALFGCGFVLMSSACLFGDDDDRAPSHPSRECEDATQCGHLNDGDACYGSAYCEPNTFTCRRDFLQDDDRCQCHSWLNCRTFGLEPLGCNEITCEDHQCGEVIVPEGPSPDERLGDCVELACDGENKEPIITVNLEDIHDDKNGCTVDTCTEDGPENDAVDDGTICEDGDGVCYAGACYPGCVPNDPESCGDEGPSEPANNDAFAATTVGEHTESCGMLDGDDVDWFEMYVVDEDFETDILGFEVRSSAATIELCVYVLCDNGGFPGGGCGNKQAGPLGSRGCCWTGPPSSLEPTWDLDCADTSDDSGTVFYSVRAPGGGACETYRVSGHY